MPFGECLLIIQSRIFHNHIFHLKNKEIKISRTIILPFVLCGCETWSLKKQHTWRVFESREVRKMLGPKRREE
jgi:hypothetical protein